MVGGFFDAPTEPCCVCDQPLPEVHFAECMVCLKPYHMRMTESEKDARDCGLTFLHEEDFYMVFMCNTCFAEQGTE